MSGLGHIAPHPSGDPKFTEALSLYRGVLVQHKSRGSLLRLTMPQRQRKKLVVLSKEFHFCCSRKGQIHSTLTAPCKFSRKSFTLSISVSIRSIQTWGCAKSLTPYSQDSITHQKTNNHTKLHDRKNHEC